MQFGKTLRSKIIKEWRFYAVDYKALKKIVNSSRAFGLDDVDVNEEEFNDVLNQSLERLSKFYFDKESWAQDYMHVLEERLESLRLSHEKSGLPPQESTANGDDGSVSSVSSSDDDTNDVDCNRSPTGAASFRNRQESDPTKRKKSALSGAKQRKQNARKEEYRAMGKSEHFQHFIYAKKSLTTFDRELNLILEFLDLNRTACSKILKKFDKVTGKITKEDKLKELLESNPHLDGEVISMLKTQVDDMIAEVQNLKPSLPDGWENRKVYTIGCFDLFHRGHQNVLMSLREFGYFIVAGIHDDESYFKLKNKYTIDNLETRMRNVKPFVDQLYVIPSTDPLMYIKSAVSEQDIEAGSCCYARGDDMLQFPGREWVESVMPVHFVPRTEKCSSTLIRTIYHAENPEIRRQAAFAKTRYDGKPVDENGKVLSLSASCPALS